MMKSKSIEVNFTKVETSSKPSYEKWKKIKQETSKAFNVRFTSGKIKKKKKVNLKKAKGFAYGNVGNFKSIAWSTQLKIVKEVSVIFVH